jgi:hypothetical protein
VIALHILIRAGAGPAAVVTAASGEVPGAAETASVAGPCDVIARAGTRDTAGRVRLGASRGRACGGVMRTAGRRPVARR